jgi:hypothetical protein
MSHLGRFVLSLVQEEIDICKITGSQLWQLYPGGNRFLLGVCDTGGSILLWASISSSNS